MSTVKEPYTGMPMKRPEHSIFGLPKTNILNPRQAKPLSYILKKAFDTIPFYWNALHSILQAFEKERNVSCSMQQQLYAGFRIGLHTDLLS